ncbi:hypothetical protein SAMN05446037_103735 [Anaerovirgula multivorans]|uniref:DUF1850 domain-containing protein n=1 Tax=Anaerovirgula multivorans TaxID=312168 RepID=A0A239JQA6_9FIRM|nr:hypothetical protein SAMN05446037_103735 [Anaerovirgula multivorans]
MRLTKDRKKEEQGKFTKASSAASKRKKAFLYFGAIISIVFLFYYIFSLQSVDISQSYIKIIDETTGEVLVTAEVEVGDEITFHWIHSVEHIPWIELFTVDQQNNLILQEIRFQGFGAGIPHDKGKEVIVENGYIIMKDIGELYPSYNWINSHTATEKIALNGEKIVEGKDLPHHGYMKMVIQER